ncbi:hypothetical protein [Nocardioides sp. KR10-350]|uniref:hypothetical protein n=1 Tax=Nocardioides cheoyonin TaxID=3156615 RepID=UPI0032B37128
MSIAAATAGKVTHARRRLGASCRACGSTNTWVEIRREADPRRPAGVGEWPYAVCLSCGHAVRGRPKQPEHETPTAEPADATPSTTGSDDARPGPDGRKPHERRPRPKVDDGRVEELLRAAGFNKEITPEVLEAHRRFATHAGKPGLPRWKAAVALLNSAQGRGEVPHVREIYAEEKRRREARRARAAQLRRQAEDLADQHAAAAREHVARVWADTGEGPTWRELAEALGVRGPLASALVDVLHRRRVLTSSEEPRSLAVAPG